MKNSSYYKIASTFMALSVFAGCASLPVQQGEYDDVYFTSADRTQPRQVVIDPENRESLDEDVITLQRSSDSKVEPALLNKYNNGEPSEVVYFEDIEPRVKKAFQLNYDDFVWDYEHELLKNYDLPLSWDDMDAFSFNQIVNNDFQFRNAWYEQYYNGNLTLMEAYVQNTSSNLNNASTYFSLGFGLGSMYNPYRFNSWGDPFYYGYNDFYNPYWTASYSFSRYRRFGWRWSRIYAGMYGWGFDPFYSPFYDPYYYNSWAYSPWGWRNNSWYWSRNTVIIADNNYYSNRNYTRGGRVRSTSVTSVRSDAVNGAGRTRSTANLNTSSRTRSTISGGRVSNSSVRPTTTSTRSSRSTSAVDRALASSSRRVRTDAYRFSRSDGSSRSTRTSTLNRVSSSRYGNPNRSNTTLNRTRTSSYPSGIRSSRSSSRSISFGRTSSSRSSSVFSRGSGSSSRSSGGFSRSSSSSGRSSSGVSRSSSSRSSGSVSRGGSSGSSRSSGGSSGSSRSSSSSGSRSGRGN
ncbi:hypothetical protein [Roseivirga sp.]|uniref:hypothetical protein n=1 Tax=Roseivirga sp. TaxID=1964215 RepID=UPI003B52346F